MNTLPLRFSYIVVLSGITVGCVSGDLAVSPDSLATMKNVALVVLEPPPLILPANMLANLPPESVSDISKAALFFQVPNADVRAGAGVLASLSGIIMLAEMSANNQAARDNFESKTQSPVPLETALKTDQAWLATVVVAKEIALRLERESELVIALTKGIVPIPGVVDRRQTFYMENWYAPIRAWYNSDRSSFDYGDMASAGVNAVLEVGIYNLHFFTEDEFFFTVMVKLIDIQSGEVVGRASETTHPSVGPVAKLFTDEGRPFKNLVADLTNQLVPLVLKNVGLLK